MYSVVANFFVYIRIDIKNSAYSRYICNFVTRSKEKPCKLRNSLFVTEETQFCVNGGLHTDLNQCN